MSISRSELSVSPVKGGGFREDQFLLQSPKTCSNGVQAGIELDPAGQQAVWQEFTAGEQRMLLTSASILIERSRTAAGPLVGIEIFRDGDIPNPFERIALSDLVPVSAEEVPEWHELPFTFDRVLLERGERYQLYPGVLFSGLPGPFDQTTWYTRRSRQRTTPVVRAASPTPTTFSRSLSMEGPVSLRKLLKARVWCGVCSTTSSRSGNRSPSAPRNRISRLTFS